MATGVSVGTFHGDALLFSESGYLFWRTTNACIVLREIFNHVKIVHCSYQIIKIQSSRLQTLTPYRRESRHSTRSGRKNTPVHTARRRLPPARRRRRLLAKDLIQHKTGIPQPDATVAIAVGVPAHRLRSLSASSMLTMKSPQPPSPPGAGLKKAEAPIPASSAMKGPAAHHWIDPLDPHPMSTVSAGGRRTRGTHAAIVSRGAPKRRTAGIDQQIIALNAHRIALLWKAAAGRDLTISPAQGRMGHPLGPESPVDGQVFQVNGTSQAHRTLNHRFLPPGAGEFDRPADGQRFGEVSRPHLDGIPVGGGHRGGDRAVVRRDLEDAAAADKPEIEAGRRDAAPAPPAEKTRITQRIAATGPFADIAPPVQGLAITASRHTQSRPTRPGSHPSTAVRFPVAKF